MRAGIQHRDRERIPEAGQGGSWRYLRMCSQQYAARLLEMLDETHVRHAEVASRSPPRRRGCQDRFPGDSACLPKCVVMMHIRMAHNAHMNLHWSECCNLTPQGWRPGNASAGAMPCGTPSNISHTCIGASAVLMDPEARELHDLEFGCLDSIIYHVTQ